MATRLILELREDVATDDYQNDDRQIYVRDDVIFWSQPAHEDVRWDVQQQHVYRDLHAGLELITPQLLLERLIGEPQR